MVRINGEKKPFSGKTVKEAAALSGYDIARIAAELNGEVVPKSDYEVTVLKEGDSLEIVGFVGGG